MNIHKLLAEALADQFKAATTVNAIEEKVCEKAKQYVFEKYKEEKHYSNGMEFELYAVKAYFCNICHALEISKVQLTLTYFCISELTKPQKKRIEKEKKWYDEYDFVTNINLKYGIPLWEVLVYEIDLDQILSGKVNLQINET